YVCTQAELVSLHSCSSSLLPFYTFSLLFVLLNLGTGVCVPTFPFLERNDSCFLQNQVHEVNLSCSVQYLPLLSPYKVRPYIRRLHYEVEMIESVHLHCIT